MQPILFRIPITAEGIPVYGFGMMLFVTFLATTWMASWRAEKVGIGRAVIQDLAIWIFLGGILGARLTYLLTVQEDPQGRVGLTDPWEILKKLPRIWDGGIVFYGAAVGGTVAYFIGYYLIFRHKENLTTLRLADVIAPAIALGLLLGRIGCFLNGCCYGAVACPACLGGVSYPLSAPARFELVEKDYQTSAGFLVERRTAEGRVEQIEPVFLARVKNPGPWGTAEARVGQLEPGSAAAASGLKRGDVITNLNGHEVKTAVDVGAQLRGQPRGQETLTLEVRRDGEEKTLTFRPRTLPLLPTQLYESISMALLMFLLFAFEPFKRRDGQLMALLMIGYGLHRFLNELLRSDQRPEGFEKYTSILAVVAGLVMMALLWRKPVPQAAARPVAA
jgi:prolipoprotein diacylglyceryltransferase